jgi:UDP-galactopyranose mutase
MPKTAIFAGRLGSYRYFDMCEVIAQARKLCDDLA